MQVTHKFVLRKLNLVSLKKFLDTEIFYKVDMFFIFFCVKITLIWKNVNYSKHLDLKFSMAFPTHDIYAGKASIC